jgi:N-acetylglucosamine-6-phosphate deacetylase
MTTITARRYDTGESIRIQTRHGRIESILPADLSAAEASEIPFVGPGLFDIQVNGFQGIWFCSESLTTDEVEKVVNAYLQQGITRCFPTLITTSCGAIEHGLATIRKARDKSELVRNVVAGCHVEGPFISPVDGPRGAHPLQHVRPADVSEFRRWQQAAGGLVRLVTLAPEVPNALDFIRHVASTGVIVSIGHTAASTEIIRQAIDCGARLGTHLGNGCAGLIPRHDNIFWPQLSDDRLTCSVIADGWHVPSAMLKCIVRCKSLERVVLTSDVSGFGGCKPGRYSTGEVSVDVLSDGRIVVAGQTQFLAGSGATTGECVAHFMQTCGSSLGDAWTLASTQPARLMKIPAADLQEGAPAHLTFFRLIETAAPDGQLGWKYQPEFSISGGIASN